MILAAKPFDELTIYELYELMHFAETTASDDFIESGIIHVKMEKNL